MSRDEAAEFVAAHVDAAEFVERMVAKYPDHDEIEWFRVCRAGITSAAEAVCEQMGAVIERDADERITGWRWIEPE